MKAKYIDLDTDFDHYDEPVRTRCYELQAKAKELLPAYLNKSANGLLNAAARALGNEGERYCGIYACKRCGQLYHTDYSTNQHPTKDYCCYEHQRGTNR